MYTSAPITKAPVAQPAPAKFSLPAGYEIRIKAVGLLGQLKGQIVNIDGEVVGEIGGFGQIVVNGPMSGS